MKSIYRKFLECKIDLTSLGIERREEDVTYFVRPRELPSLDGRVSMGSIIVLFVALGRWCLRSAR